MSELSWERERHRDSTDGEALKKGSKHEWPEVREAVAMNPFTPPGVLVRLSQDPDMQVRWAVAENPSVPVDTLRLLLADRDPNVADTAFEFIIDRDLIGDDTLRECAFLFLAIEDEAETRGASLLAERLVNDRAEWTRDRCLQQLLVDPTTRQRLEDMDLDW